MRILLTGASGLLGSNFAVAAADRGHEVVGVVGHWAGAGLPGLARQLRLDLRDPAALAIAMRELAPEAIVNSAAISEMARCEAEPELSQLLNVALPRRLAEMAQALGARLVHVSSEQVFDGTRAPYRPDDAVSPLHLYGRQKVESERAVTAAAPDSAAIVRAPLLLGHSPGGRRSVHERLLLDWSEGRPLRLHTDEIRQPCLAENLAAVLVELCERRELRGIFHWGGAEAVSRFELGRAIARHFRLPEGKIEAVRRRDTPGAAHRPPNLALDLAPLEATVRTRPENMATQVARLQVPPALRAWLEQETA